MKSVKGFQCTSPSLRVLATCIVLIVGLITRVIDALMENSMTQIAS